MNKKRDVQVWNGGHGREQNSEDRFSFPKVFSESFVSRRPRPAPGASHVCHSTSAAAAATPPSYYWVEWQPQKSFSIFAENLFGEAV